MAFQQNSAIGNRSLLIETDGDFSVGEHQEKNLPTSTSRTANPYGPTSGTAPKIAVATRDFELNKTQSYCTIRAKPVKTGGAVDQNNAVGVDWPVG